MLSSLFTYLKKSILKNPIFGLLFAKFLHYFFAKFSHYYAKQIEAKFREKSENLRVYRERTK